MNKKQWKQSRFEHYIFGLLIAVELIMSFTFLGYIHIPPVSVTTAYIPIVVIACLFGVRESVAAGLIFGLGSMYKASALYVMPGDRIFSPFQSGYPLESFLLSVGTRALFGVLIGLLFVLAKKRKYSRIWKGAAAFIAPKLHAFLVYTVMGICFPEIGFNFRSVFNLNSDAKTTALLCLICVMACDLLYHSSYVQHYKEAVNRSDEDSYWSPAMVCSLGGICAFIFSMAVFSTIYFADRMTYMLGQHGMEIVQAVQSDILHLQIQFLAAMLALNFILILVILLTYRYMKYKEYCGQIDGLTGVMGRRLFLEHCTRMQMKSHREPGKPGWFLFLDVDWFKQINDTFGHSVGDTTLRSIARILQKTFDGSAAVGRVGGDEFAVMIDQPLTKEELEKKLADYLEEISHILNEVKVSSSIGACHFIFPHDMSELLRKTDEVLYEAKRNGRACFVIRDELEQKAEKEKQK